jgi:proteasome assembly chaperone (PAC2) family protein
MKNELRHPWLVAVWPGMGGVAQIAGTYLSQQLRAEEILELDPHRFFEPRSVAVKDGLAHASPLPRTVLRAWRNRAVERDLLLLVGDQQPAAGGFRYAQAVLDAARAWGIERVVTFAAMATPIHPSGKPRVFGVATRQGLIDELKRHDVTLLEEGEISGLNGTLLAAAEAQGIPAICLLGEFPFFAAQLPNPKASAAVLEVFGRLSGIAVDAAPLLRQAESIERTLVQHLEELQREAAAQAEANGESEAEMLEEQEPGTAEPFRPARPERPVAKEALDRVESLFSIAKDDRQKAIELKAELDRLGLFKRFEDRFLDLFKKAG